MMKAAMPPVTAKDIGDLLKKGKLIAPLATALPPRKLELSPMLRARNATTINRLVVGISLLNNDSTINSIRNSRVIAPNTTPAIGNHEGTSSVFDALLSKSTGEEAGTSE
jgi:hypothetical protein